MQVKVHEFFQGDVDEVFLYATAGIHQWMEESPEGQWLKSRNIELDYITSYVPNHYLTTVTIFAEMSEQEQTLFHLKFG